MEIKAKLTSVNLKSNPVPYTTTSRAVYADKSNAVDKMSLKDTEFIKSIKSNHFEYGDGIARSERQLKRHYETSQKASYVPMKAASPLVDIEHLKKDLRSNHFQYGGASTNVKEPSSRKQFKRMSLKQIIQSKQSIDKLHQADLRASHFNLGSAEPTPL